MKQQIDYQVLSPDLNKMRIVQPPEPFIILRNPTWFGKIVAFIINRIMKWSMK